VTPRVAWFVAALACASILFQDPEASADMCGPSNLPGVSSVFPWVKGCEPWVPFAGNVPQIPFAAKPPNVPQPVPGIGGAGGWLAPGYPGSGPTPPWGPAQTP